MLSAAVEHHRPLSITHAEPDYLRTLTAVNDTPAQRTKSALDVALPGCSYSRRVIGLDPGRARSPAVMDGEELPEDHQMARTDQVVLYVDIARIRHKM